MANLDIIILALFLGFLIGFLFFSIWRAKQDRVIIEENVKGANFLSFFIENLTVLKGNSKAFLLISDYIKKQTNLTASYILASHKNSFDEFEVLHKDSYFPNISYFGGIVNGDKVTIKQGSVLHRVLQNKNSYSLSHEELQNIFDSSLLVRCKSVIIIPLFLSGDLEAIACFTQEKEKGFSFKKSVFLKNYCDYLILAKKYIESYVNFQEQEGLHKELQVARQIQTKLMPLQIPNLGELDLVAMNRSAKDVSGDFYDFIDIADDKILVVIGDASGKGVPACIIGVMTRSIIRSLSVHFESLEDILLRLNKSLFEDLERNRFITLAFAFIDKKRNVIECARAGHTSILLKNSQNKIIDIKPKGIALGLLPTSQKTVFETFSMVFPKGCEMMLFSDGLVEQTNSNGDEFSLERLRESWFKNDAEYESLTQVAEGIFKDVKNYAGYIPREDDQTLILISRS